MVSGLESVTVGVSDLDAALKVFRDTMGLRVESDTQASVSLLGAWRLPVHSDVRLVELSAAGYPFGRVRLARFDPAPTIATRLDSGPNAPDSATDVGPKALDFYTGSPAETALKKLEKAGCRRRGDPVRYRVGESEQEEVVVSGPEGVPLLLMVGHTHDKQIMRQAIAAGEFSELATMSVVTADLDASRRFYGEVLGLTAGLDIAVPPAFREHVCRLTGVPENTNAHFIVYRDDAQPSGKILLAHFFDATTDTLEHPMRPGQIGVNLFSVRCEDLDVLEPRLRASGAEILARPTHVALGNGAPARVMLARGPNMELFEFIERTE